MTDERFAKMALDVFNVPFLIHADAMEIIMRTVDGGMRGEGTGMLSVAREPRPAREGIAVIPVFNVLTYRDGGGLLSMLFGDGTYERIREEFRAAMADPGIRAVVFDIDSPGGEVSGAFDLVDEIHQARGLKPIYAVANEVAYSAAYAIASAADRIYLPRTGGVGSVGVLAMHVDQSALDAQRGLKYTPVYAGARKTEFSSHAPLSAEAFREAQEQVDAIYDLFVSTVARNRGMDPERVRATEAAIFKGEKAVQAGLADRVIPWGIALGEIAKDIKEIGRGRRMNLKAKLEAAIGESPREQVEAAMAELGYVPKPAGEQPPVVDVEKVRTEAAEAAKTETTMRIMGVLEVCFLAGMEKMAVGLIRDGVNVEEARGKVLEAKAAEAARTPIRSTVGATSTGEVNPLLSDARRRADAGLKQQR